MKAILNNPYRTAGVGLVIAVILFVVYGVLNKSELGAAFGTKTLWAWLFVWLHVLSGIMWIGHLYYFNFVQMIVMPKIPAEQKPAVSKFVAPEALWWFRWAAMATIITGLVVAWLRDYVDNALALGLLKSPFNPGEFFIGVGMWLGVIMWFNVWFIIWPNQKKALNIADSWPSLKPEERTRAADLAKYFSRTNMMLSIPLLLSMTGGGLNSALNGL